MARVARKAFAGFGHEARCDAEFAAKGFDDISEHCSQHLGVLSWALTDLNNPALSAICEISPNSRACHTNELRVRLC